GAAAVVAVAIASSAVATRAPDLLRLPTDAREQAFVREHARALDNADRVVFLHRAGLRVMSLPLHARCTGRGPGVQPLDGDRPLPALATLGDHLVYYRSSLCAAREVRDLCARLEASGSLAPIATRRLPAVPSLRFLAYDADVAAVG